MNILKLRLEMLQSLHVHVGWFISTWLWIFWPMISLKLLIEYSFKPVLGGFSSWVWLQSTISEVTIKRLLIFTREFCLTTGIQIIMSFILFYYWFCWHTIVINKQIIYHLLKQKIIAVGTLTAVISVWSAAPVPQRSGFTCGSNKIIWNSYIHHFK